MNALTVIEPASNVDMYRASTDAAGMCREIVVASATSIQGRSYVTVEGWQAIAVAHGCTASARGVERVEGGVRAIGEIRRMSDGIVIAEAEGFVGEDEPVWFGGKDHRGKVHPRRADYAIRAMAQTRAISRACRSAFAHVVVMMKANLSTTPAEEVPMGGFEDAPRAAEPRHDPTPATISDDQRNQLSTMLEQSGTDVRRFCEAYGIASLPALPADKFSNAFKRLDATLKAKAKPAAAPAADILDDEVPY